MDVKLNLRSGPNIQKINHLFHAYVPAPLAHLYHTIHCFLYSRETCYQSFTSTKKEWPEFLEQFQPH